MKRHELFNRQTIFSRTLVAEMWDGLSLLERVDFLLNLVELRQSLMDNELRSKVLNDPNPVVRMLAVKCNYISEDKEPDLYAQLKADPSAVVRVALLTGFCRDLKPLSHAERLGVIALSEKLSDIKDFAEFIVNGLQGGQTLNEAEAGVEGLRLDCTGSELQRGQTLSEAEAAELVREYVLNPKLAEHLGNEPVDAYDMVTKGKIFEAIWNLTTCTWGKVHSAIAEYYPMRTIDCSISEAMIERFNDNVLGILVYRQYRPLLELIKNKPERFSKEVKKDYISMMKFYNMSVE